MRVCLGSFATNCCIKFFLSRIRRLKLKNVYSKSKPWFRKLVAIQVTQKVDDGKPVQPQQEI